MGGIEGGRASEGKGGRRSQRDGGREQRAGRGRNRHSPLVSAEAGPRETLSRRCIVSVLGEGIVKSWYGVKGKTLRQTQGMIVNRPTAL